MKKKIVKAKNKKAKDKEKYYYIQDWGTFDLQTMVCLRMTYEDVVAANKKIGTVPEMAKCLEQAKPILQKSLENNPAFFFFDKVSGGSFIFLKDWDHTPEWNDILVHETHHAVHICMGEVLQIWDEKEALAYQQGYLIRQIRDQLNKICKLGKYARSGNKNN